jgi:hypothetical protein
VSVSGDGNTAIIGGFGDNSVVGAAWVFTRSRRVWSQQGPKLVGTGAVGPAGQGRVSISGDGNTAIVGGSLDNHEVGAAWVFTQQPLFAGTPGMANCIGQSVAALAQQYGELNAAAAALGFDSAGPLQGAIQEFCEA